MDSKLARIGFMTPVDVGSFVDYLEKNGLVFILNGKAEDIVVVDQFKGPTVPCDWLEVVNCSVENIPCVACKLKNDSATTIYVPANWENKESKTIRIEREEIEKRLLYLGREDNVECYLDLYTLKEVYVGRIKEGGAL